MNPSDYEFKVGDKVITIDGYVGQIVHICTCDRCKERGFYEPTWQKDDNDEFEYITNYVAESGFKDYYQIGKYKFGHEFDKKTVAETVKYFEETVKRVKKRLKFIKKLERSEKRLHRKKQLKVVEELD